MVILAVECSTSLGSVAISRFSDILSSLSWKHQKSHEKVIVSSLSQALQEAHLTFKDINLLAVGNGPGSFTGLRVALSVVKTLSYAYDLPVAVFNSLRILAENYQNSCPERVYTLQNAFSAKFFFAHYLKNGLICQEIEKPQLIAQEQIRDVLKKPGMVLGCVSNLICQNPGSQSQRLQSRRLQSQRFFLNNNKHLKFVEDSLINYPDAKKLAILCSRQKQSYFKEKWQQVFPLYLKMSAAEEKINFKK